MSKTLGLAAATLFALFLQPLAAQEVAAPEEDAPVVTTQDVQAALEELLASGGPEPSDAVSTADPDISLVELDIVLEPLMLSDLRNEIAGWSDLLRGAVEDLSAAELQLFEINQADTPSQDGGEASGGDGAATPAVQDPETVQLVERIGELRETRTARADRFKHVLDTFVGRGGDPAETDEARAYIADVGGVRVDTRNIQTTLLTVREWALSEDGGLRIARNVGIVLASLLGGLVIGWIAGRVVNLFLKGSELTSNLLRRFLRKWITRVGGAVGFLVGLSWIGTNMTPILAGLGAAGFILAFALQNSIGNFASGLLILLQRPFDAGDDIEAAGVSGEVESVSLFSTHLKTDENRKVIVPNNMIWEDVVVNSTSAATRRLSIEIEVNAEEHDIDDSERILMSAMEHHPGVLDDPQPEVMLDTVTAESFTFTCRPWVATQDKDKIRRELVARFSRDLALVKGATKAKA